MNAYLLTGNARYLDAWRTQMDTISARGRLENGRRMTPRMYGTQGWYAYEPGDYNLNALELYFLSWHADDRRRVPSNPWLDYLDGKNPDYPVRALRGELARIRERVQGMRADTTTPDTRLADDPMDFNPASVTALIQLAEGGLHITRRAAPLHCRLRYFDPERRRAGLPEDMAALVEAIGPDSVTVSLVNTNQLETRSVVLQAGAYAEHQFLSVTADAGETPVDAPVLTVRLEPGCGGRLMLRMRRFANAPRLAFPFR